jgi:hypothetical protein
MWTQPKRSFGSNMFWAIPAAAGTITPPEMKKEKHLNQQFRSKKSLILFDIKEGY